MASAMLTSLSSMLATQTQLDVISNNLANLQTSGFKRSRVDFADQLYNQLGGGRGPAGSIGGVDPKQVGNGADVRAISVQFQQGAINPTGRELDVAITGDGFFRLQTPEGEVYSRVGSFGFDAGTGSGQRLVELGSGGIVLNTQGQPITLVRDLAGQATTRLDLEGTLAPIDPRPLQGDRLTSLLPLKRSDGAPTTSGAPLADLTIARGPAAATTLTVFGTEADGTAFQRTVPLSATATVQDLINGLHAQLTKAVPVLDGNGNPVLDGNNQPVTKVERIAQVRVDGGSLVAEPTATGGQFSLFLGEAPAPPQPVTTAAANVWQHTADGTYAWDRVRFTPSSVSSTFQLYTADGTRHELSGKWFSTGIDGGLNRSWDLVFDQPTGGTLATGSIQGVVFAPDGTLTTAPTPTIASTWTTGGASSVAIDTSRLRGQQGSSAVDVIDITGFPPGQLQKASIDQFGRVLGTYSNDKTVPMSANGHQIGLALFANPGGLLNLGGNQWQVSQNSGPAATVAPGDNATNLITGGALEGSNVNLADEFSRLILAQRAFQSSSRAFQTADEMIKMANELIR